MISKRVKLDFNGKGWTKALLGACVHVGQPSVDYDGVRKFVREGKKYAWACLGDLIEGIMPTDTRRFNIDEHKTSILEQMEYAVELHKPAAEKCLGLIRGNHELFVSKQFGDISKSMAKDMGVPYLGMCAILDLVCPDGMTQLYMAHGSKGFGGVAGDPERIKLNREIKLRNNNKKFDADIVAVAHAHTSVITPPVYKMKLGSVEGKLKMVPVPVERTWYSASPAFFRTYVQDNENGSYGEQAQFDPTDCGWHAAIINKDGSVPKMIQYGTDGKIISERTPNIIR